MARLVIHVDVDVDPATNDARELAEDVLYSISAVSIHVAHASWVAE